MSARHYYAELERHRVNDAEEYNILKIRLETDVQNLEQHLEAAPARRWSPRHGIPFNSLNEGS